MNRYGYGAVGAGVFTSLYHFWQSPERGASSGTLPAPPMNSAAAALLQPLLRATHAASQLLLSARNGTLATHASHIWFHSPLLIVQSLVISAIFFGRLFLWIFFGPLREIEKKTLSERAVYTSTQFLMTLLVLRENLSIKFLASFFMIIFLKFFHWLCNDRAEYMWQRVDGRAAVDFRAPQIRSEALSHFRFVVGVLVLEAIDVFVILSCLRELRISGKTALTIVLVFEVSILYLSIGYTAAKYVACYVEWRYLQHQVRILRQRRAHSGTADSSEAVSDAALDAALDAVPDSWPQKRLVLFSARVVVQFLQFMIYCIFSGVLLADYCFPLHLFPEGYTALRVLIAKTRRFIRYSREMNLSYLSLPDATLEDFRGTDVICAICRCQMVVSVPVDVAVAAGGVGNVGNVGGVGGAAGPRATVNRYYRMDPSTPKRLGCGHAMHNGCLFELVSSASTGARCPICRHEIFVPKAGRQARSGAGGKQRSRSTEREVER